MVKMLIRAGATVLENKKNVRTVLHDASEKGDTSILRYILSAGISTDVQDENNRGPIHEATLQSHGRVIKVLLQNNADVNLKDTEGNTAMHLAAMEDSDAIVKLLLLFKADINSQNKDGDCPLHLSTAKSHFLTTEVLLTNHGAVDIKNKVGESAFDIAVGTGKLNMVKLYLNIRADIRLQNQEYESVLCRAAINGHLDLLSQLLKHGANIDGRDSTGETILHKVTRNGNIDQLKMLLNHGINVDMANYDGKTALMVAARQNSIDSAEILLSHGANSSVQDTTGETVWHIAVKWRHFKFVDLLVDKMQDVTVTDKEGRTALHMMAYLGYEKCLNSVLHGRIDIELKDHAGLSVLATAATKGHVDTCKLLIRYGANINSQDKDGSTPLKIAGCGGYTDVVDLLLQCGADANIVDEESYAPLHYATLKGYSDIVKLLVEYGADIHVTDKVASLQDGRTALHEAAKDNLHDLLRFLLKKGSEINASDNEGRTSLHEATLNSSYECLQILLNNGATVNALDLCGRSALHEASRRNREIAVQMLINHDATVNVKDKNGLTPLHEASISCKGSLDVIDALLSAGAKPNTKDNVGRTALMDAASSNSKNNVVIQMMIKAGADVNLTDQNGRTALMDACSKRFYEIAQILLTFDCKINMTDLNGRTTLHEAARNGDLHLVELLIQQGADMNIQDKSNQTVLHKVIKSQDLEAIVCVLKACPDINVQDEDGRTALSLAIFQGDREAVELLLGIPEIDVNIQNKSGHTALHEAARREQGVINLIDLLLRTNIDVNAYDKFGKTALNFATARGHKNAVLLLVQGGAQIVPEDLKFIKDGLDDVCAVARFCDVEDEIWTINTASCEELYRELRSSKCVEIDRLTIQSDESEDLTLLMENLAANGIHAHQICLVNIQGFVNGSQLARCQPLVERLTLVNSSIRHPEALRHLESLSTLRIIDCGLLKMIETIEMRSLEVLDISHNRVQVLPRSLSQSKMLKVLRCNHNSLLHLPMDIGHLAESLIELRVHTNKLSSLPASIAMLSKLESFTYHNNRLHNIPSDLQNAPFSEIKKYLKALLTDPVPNTTVKMLLVGQEGVGKTTMVKALKRQSWFYDDPMEVGKTDGIDISSFKIGDVTLRCFDCGGDADFNETHNFFMTSQTIYLACFNLSEYSLTTFERNNHMLGRLQLWLQYIFSKAPESRVIVVGTHADHPSLNPILLNKIWEQVQHLLNSSRSEHNRIFRRNACLSECLICQPPKLLSRQAKNSRTAGFVTLTNPPPIDTDDDDDEEEVVDDDVFLQSESEDSEYEAETMSRHGISTFPHVVGYVEVSSMRKVGNRFYNFTTNESMENLKQIIERHASAIIEENPTIPKLWFTIKNILHREIGQVNREQCYVSVDRVRDVYRQFNGLDDEDFKNMLLFFKSQGDILYFPKIEEIANLIILDPMWLAKRFCSLVSFKDTGLEDGFLDREKLNETWPDMIPKDRDKLLILFRQFGVCIPIEGSNTEMFPCKLPLGEPDDSLWPQIPSPVRLQLTYVFRLAFVPPSFFSTLIYMNFKTRHAFPDSNPHTFSRYLSNHIVDILSLTDVGCQDCEHMTKENCEEGQIHRVHYEILPHRREFHISVRGPRPCCMMRNVNETINKAISWFEGMQPVTLDDLACPMCIFQHRDDMHIFSARQLRENSPHVAICCNGHELSSAAGLLTGKILDSYLPRLDLTKHMEAMDDRECPKLFVVLPVNRDGLSLGEKIKLWASSLLFDGFAVHLLCEFPGGFHFTKSPGYRLNRAGEFMQFYGNHVVSILYMIGLFARASGNYTTIVEDATEMSDTIDELIEDYRIRFPTDVNTTDITDPDIAMRIVNENARSFSRSRLRHFLNVIDKPGSFGSLWRLPYKNQILWLCPEHYKRLKKVVIKR
ncbi:uncharacterized protein LOC141915032 [Tubulanus polymorphus]|uniref:uncharacterized protein LOC141915032 n=1 Tax=Tubulanus polymorphus TaxID=672921 RepID=UPI003DA69C4E